MVVEFITDTSWTKSYIRSYLRWNIYWVSQLMHYSKWILTSLCLGDLHIDHCPDPTANKWVPSIIQEVRHWGAMSTEKHYCRCSQPHRCLASGNLDLENISVKTVIGYTMSHDSFYTIFILQPCALIYVISQSW